MIYLVSLYFISGCRRSGEILMKIDETKLEKIYLLAGKALEQQNCPDYLKKRWQRAFAKAREKIPAEPFFAWEPERLTLLSIPSKSGGGTACRFYSVTQAECRRLDRTGYCQAYFDGFPCWHRAAFSLLRLYFRRFPETRQKTLSRRTAKPPEMSTEVDSFS